MNTITEQAEQFIHGAARVLERRRFAYLFRDGPVEPLLTALAAYRNDDGGYGHALEPDGRGPGSQPVHALFALMVPEDTSALDGELAAGICDHLASITWIQSAQALSFRAGIADPGVSAAPRPDQPVEFETLGTAGQAGTCSA